MRIGRFASPFVVMFEHIIDCLGHAIEIGHLVEHAVHLPFGTRPIVAHNVYEQCIVHFAQVFDCRHKATDLVISMFSKSCIYFHLACK